MAWLEDQLGFRGDFLRQSVVFDSMELNTD